MKRISYYFIILTPFVFLALAWGGQPFSAVAQGLEEQQEEQTLEQREQQLEQQLNINRQNERDYVEGNVDDEVDHVSPNVEDVPDPDEGLGLDDNLPYQPADEEAEIQL